MSKDSHIDHNSSLYPEQDSEEVDDNSWQISYLDVITILLGFLIIMLSTSNFTEENFFSLSSLFKSDVEEAAFITTPINKVQEQLSEALEAPLAENKIKLERDLNDLLIQLNSDKLYLSGSATIQTESLSLLNSITQAIKDLKYNDFNIEVEGHTDDVPIRSSAYQSNWELSTARATNMVKFLAGMGIPKERLKASGYADSRPIAPNVNTSGAPIPENRARNRRVTLRLFYSAPAQDSTQSQIATLDRNCTYSIQLGEFRSFGNALKEAKKVINKSGIDFNITHNGQLFSVRSLPHKDLTSTLDQYKALENANPQKDKGIIHQCYSEPNDSPAPVPFRVQLGAFNSEQNALTFASALRKDHDIIAEVSSSQSGIFRVISTPRSSLQQTLEQARYIENVTGKDNFISYSGLNASPYSFDYKIQIGTFQSAETANQTSDKISSLMSLNSTVKATEETFFLVSETLPDWPSTLQAYEDLSNTSYDLEPVIYLLENISK